MNYYYIVWLAIFLLPNSLWSREVLNQELPFVVAICSYKNAEWAVKNLDSLFAQDYQNFRVIYVDDCSPDDTAAIVRAYCDEHNLHDRITIIANQTRCRKMHNIYKAYHSCHDDEIVVQLDGDDWFADNQALSYLNGIYQDNDVWITYGSYQDYPSGQRGYARDAPDWVWDKRLFRHWQWVYMPTRTFRAWLFKQVRLQDFITGCVPRFKSKFYPSSNDTAMMYPMLEMAGRHGKYIDKILYIANRGNPLIGIKSGTYLLNTNRWAYIEQCKLEEYPALDQPAFDRFNAYQDSKAACLILSDNNPEGLQKLLSSRNKLDGVSAIHVLYSCDQAYKNLYEKLMQEHVDIVFNNIADQSADAVIKDTLQSIQHEHILFALDAVTVKEHIIISRCVQELEKTFAHAFYLGLNHEQALEAHDPDQHMYDDLYAWKFNCRTGKQYNNPVMTLYTRDILQAVLRDVTGTTISEFLSSWHSQLVDERKIGLYFAQSKINISGNTVPESSEVPLQQLLQLAFVMCFNALLAAFWYCARE